MRQFIIIFTFCCAILATSNSYSQIERKHKDFALELSGGYIEPDDFEPEPIGGITLNYFLGKRVSVISRFSMGVNHLHFSPSLLTAPLLIYTESWKGGAIFYSNDIFYTAFLFATALENIGFHFNVQQNVELSPYISLLSFRGFRDDNSISLWRSLRASGAVGVKMNIFLRTRFYLSPYAEAFLQYNQDGTWGTNLGVHLGYTFPN